MGLSIPVPGALERHGAPQSRAVGDSHHRWAWGSAGVLVPLVLSPAAAPACSAHIHWLLIALKIFKD